MRDDRREAQDRRRRILEGARTAFLRFGFGRSSLADIAKGAGVSRTALYHYFPGKDDVLHALIEAFHARTHQLALQALAESTSLASALRGLLDAKFGRALDLMNESPHGVELVDATHRLTGPATRAADAAFHELVVDALVRHGRPAEANAVAGTVIAATKGLMRSGDVNATKAEFGERVGRLIDWATK